MIDREDRQSAFVPLALSLAIAAIVVLGVRYWLHWVLG